MENASLPSYQDPLGRASSAALGLVAADGRLA